MNTDVKGEYGNTCKDCYEIGVIRNDDSPRLVSLCPRHALRGLKPAPVFCADCRIEPTSTYPTTPKLCAYHAATPALVAALDQLCGFLNATPLRLNQGDSMTLSMLTDSARTALSLATGETK